VKRVTFDYPNTCPKIDRAIVDAKAKIEEFLRDFLEEASPFTPKAERHRIADCYAGTLYDSLEDAFEEVRGTNEDMRREAESQIAKLADQLDNMEHELGAAS